MYRKIHKFIFIFMFATLLMATSTTVFAAQNTPIVKRLSGDNRYATASAVALSKWSQSDYAILAYGQDFPDALSAAPLAKKYNAPILLTETDFIPKETLDAIQQLKVKTTIIIGGTGIISSSVEQQLISSGITVKRIFGQDRYETGIKIAEQLDNVNEIAIVTGESFPDALSISPVAVKKNMPIILIQHNAIPSVVTNYINTHKLAKTYVIGSGSSLNNAILTGLSNIELITGNDKYQINLNIIDKFKSDLDLSTVYIATGENFADALSGSILAGSNSNPLVLVGKDSTAEKSYFINNFKDLSRIYILGGIGAVNNEVINELIGTSAPSTVDRIEFVSNDLTKVGANTATFQYRVLDQNGMDITKTIPAYDIEAAASVGSSVSLNPLTGIGTITFKSSSDIDKQIIVTLVDKAIGKTVTLTTKVSDSMPVPINTGNTSVAKIDIIPTSLTKTGTNTATFQYKVMDKAGADITKTVSSSDLYAISWIGSSSAAVSIDPSTGTGKITYNFSDNDKNITVQLVCNNGIVGMATLFFDGTVPQEDTKISEIHLNSTTATKTGINTFAFKYQILNKSYTDITKLIPASQIAATITANGSISLDPSTGIGTIMFKSSDDIDSIDSIVTVTLIDKMSNISVYAALNTEATSQKISKIIINSSKLAVTSSGIGYATFKALDQDENDITNTSLVNGIRFKSEVATVTQTNNGILVVTPNAGIDFSKLTSIVITAYDTNTGVSTSATLAID